MVIFALFYCLLDLRSGECNVVSLYFCVALSMDCLFCVLRVGDLFGETICNIFVCVVPVVPVSV